jgi:hypothetical protein
MGLCDKTIDSAFTGLTIEGSSARGFSISFLESHSLQ